MHDTRLSRAIQALADVNFESCTVAEMRTVAHNIDRATFDISLRTRITSSFAVLRTYCALLDAQLVVLEIVEGFPDADAHKKLIAHLAIEFKKKIIELYIADTHDFEQAAKRAEASFKRQKPPTPCS